MPDIETASRWYPAADPVHGFDHVLRVYRLAEQIARREGADLEIVHAAVLLHDAHDPALPGGSRQNHHHESADFARRVLAAEGWPDLRIEAVVHCIRAHRFRDQQEEPASLEARVLFDADKLDAIGAIGAARAVAYAARAGQPAYAAPSAEFLETGRLEPGEAHSSYHEYLFKLRHLADRLFTASGRSIAQGRQQFLAEFYQELEAEVNGDR